MVSEHATTLVFVKSSGSDDYGLGLNGRSQSGSISTRSDLPQLPRSPSNTLLCEYFFYDPVARPQRPFRRKGDNGYRVCNFQEAAGVARVIRTDVKPIGADRAAAARTGRRGESWCSPYARQGSCRGLDMPGYVRIRGVAERRSSLPVRITPND